jgi:hypothetical protein
MRDAGKFRGDTARSEMREIHWRYTQRDRKILDVRYKKIKKKRYGEILDERYSEIRVGDS